MTGSITTFKPGDVLTYRPDPSRHDPNWCREGMAIVNAEGTAFDTYWASGSEAHRLQADELTTAEVIFNIGEYEELDGNRHGIRRTWETYREDQRQVVTSQHRLQARFFVLKGAQPDLDTQVMNARAALEKAREELVSAGRAIEWCTADLTRLQVKRGDFS